MSTTSKDQTVKGSQPTLDNMVEGRGSPPDTGSEDDTSPSNEVKSVSSSEEGLSLAVNGDGPSDLKDSGEQSTKVKRQRKGASMSEKEEYIRVIQKLKDQVAFFKNPTKEPKTASTASNNLDGNNSRQEETIFLSKAKRHLAESLRTKLGYVAKFSGEEEDQLVRSRNFDNLITLIEGLEN